MRTGNTLVAVVCVLALLAIAAAICAPRLLDRRLMSREAGAATALKSGVLPAQIAFQAGGYVDVGSAIAPRVPNGIGDYAEDLSHLAGRHDGVAGNAVPDEHLSLLPSAWNRPDGEIESVGYRFAVTARFESNFVAAAWPIDAEPRNRRYAINASGTVYATPLASANRPVPLTAPFGPGLDTPQPGWSAWRR